MPKFASPTAYMGKQGNQQLTGQARFANATEAAAGEADNLIISPATLDSAVDTLLPDATEVVKGKIRIATDAEAIAGTDDTIAMTPHTVGLVAIAGAPDWSEITKGILEKATTAEAEALTSDDVGISPLKLAQALAGGNAVLDVGAITGSGAVDIDTTGAISLDADAASNFSVAGAGIDLTLASDAGRVIVNGEEAAANAITLLSAAGGIDVDAALQINIASSQNAVDAIRVVASAGGIDIDAVGAATEDINITNTGGSVVIVATENAADAVVINASAGGIDITAAGAATEDIDITNTAGSIRLTAGEAVADAIVLVSSGGIDADAVGQVNIASSQSAADSIVIVSSAGGIDILASGATAGEDIDIAATGSSVNVSSTENAALAITLNTNGGTSETIRVRNQQGTAAGSIELVSTAGGLTLTGGLATGDAVNISTSDAGGGIDIDAGTAGFIVDTTGGISLDSAAASNFTATGAFDITVQSTAGSILLNAGEAVTDAINIDSTGGFDLNAALEINIDSAEAAVADAVRIVASAADGGIDIDAGTGGITIDSTGALSLDAAAASNMTVTGAGLDLTLASVLGSVLVSSTEDAPLAIRLHANGGTSETIQIHSDLGTGVASIDVLSDVGGITLTSGLASADAINLNASAGGVDVDGALQVNIASSQDAADAIRILASAGGIDIDAVGAAAQDIVITNTGGSCSVVATESTADAIVINASGAAGGIDLSTGGGSIDLSSAGSVTMVAGTDSQAGATCTVNKNVFACTYTGFTTAAAGTQTFTITNSVVTTSSQVLLTVCNEGTNDAQMTIRRVKRLAGSIEVYTVNSGAAALNGNVTITGWVIG